MTSTTTTMTTMTLPTCCGRGLWGGGGGRCVWLKPPNGFVKNSCGCGTTQQSTSCDDDNNNDNVDDDNKDDNDDEMTNDKDRACRGCREAYHSCDKDVTRRGEIALVTTMSEAWRNCAPKRGFVH